VECPGSIESRSLFTVFEDLEEFVNVRAIVCDQFDVLPSSFDSPSLEKILHMLPGWRRTHPK
jgi:hypothetical protein